MKYLYKNDRFLSDYNDCDSRAKGRAMQEINNYIDLHIIDEYTNNMMFDGNSIEVDSISPHDLSNFLDELMKHDTNVRDFVLYEMQKLINQRLNVWQEKQNYSNGLVLSCLSNGDTRYDVLGGYDEN